MKSTNVNIALTARRGRLMIIPALVEVRAWLSRLKKLRVSLAYTKLRHALACLCLSSLAAVLRGGSVKCVGFLYRANEQRRNVKVNRHGIGEEELARVVHC